MKKYLFLLPLVICLFSCKKTTEKLNIAPISELYPISVGKTFIYRLDSTVSASFGASLVTKSYLAKDTIESTFLDASGRTSFRIFRYLTDTLATQPWAYTATYYSTIDSNKVEYNDNNLRFITLVNPVSYNTTWKGNAYINTALGTSPYYFLDNWDYHYSSIDGSFTCLKGNLQHTYTVTQQDSQTPAVFDASIYNDKSYSIEVYAKGVGLIYKDFIHYVWQPTPQPARFQDDSWGIRLNLIYYK